MPPFVKPGPVPAKRTSAPVRHSDAEIARKRAAFTEADKLFRKPIAKAAPVAPAGRTSHLSSFMSGADTMGRLAPTSPARKAEAEPLHPKAAALASRTGPRGALVLSAVAQRAEEEKGRPIEVSPSDVAKLVGIDIPSATTLLTDLTASGLLLPRNNALGSLAGYVLPAA